jgi:hypothetical protein
MITLIHGDNIEISRREFNRFRDAAKGREIRQIDGRTVDEGMLIQAVESSSLFSGGTLVVIEHLFGKIGKNTKKVAAFAAILNTVKNVDVVLWEEKELGPSIVKQLHGIANRLFAIPPQIFAFLDNIKPDNAKMLLPLYASLITEDAPELVFSMLIKRVRNLIQLKDHQVPAGTSPWQMNRLTTQANSFTMDQLTGMYIKLHDIEVLLRSGSAPFGLAQYTELFITSL